MSGQASLAVRQAAPQSRAAPVTLQRTCSCEQTGESCARCAGKGLPLQRLAVGGAIPSGMPTSVGDALRTNGHPLPAHTRTDMENSFGRDFSKVRIHDDAMAQASAADVQARAYTVGHHVVLGRSAPDLGSSAGRRLLGHELAHVLQQSQSSGVADGIDPDPALESEADRAGAAVADGRPIGSQQRSPIAIQREAEEPESYPNLEKIAGYIGRLMGFAEAPTRVVAASLEGGVSGFMQRWRSTTKALLGKQLQNISWLRDLPQMYKGYVIGLFEGVVSPITDLFQIGVMLEDLNHFVNNVAMSALTKAGELAQDLRGIGQEFGRAYGEMKAAIKKQLHEAKREVFNAVIGIITSNGSLVEKAVGFARSVGRTQGEEVAKSLEAPFAGKQPAPPKEAPHGLLGMIEEKVAGDRDAQLENPWAKVGNKAGYAFGFALIQVVMLLFSEGIGNVLGIFAKSLSGLAKAGTMLGKALEGIAKFIAAAGKFINMIEEGVNAATTFVMKPLMPILEPILKPFGAVLERLGKTLRKLFNVAEKDASLLANKAATKALGEPHLAPPPAVPHPGGGGGAPATHGGGAHAPSSAQPPKVAHTETPPSAHAKAPAHAEPPKHVEVPKPVETPKPGEHAPTAKAPPHAAEPKPSAAKSEPHFEAPKGEPHPAAKSAPESHSSAKGAHEPEATKSPVQESHDPAHKPPPSGSDAAHKPLAEPEPVTAGGEPHHTQVTPDGIELCSGPPCPNLRQVYSKELGAHAQLREELEALDKLRKEVASLQAAGKPNPALAKKASQDAAKLQQKLEAAKAAGRTPIGPLVDTPQAPLQSGPYSSGKDAVAGHHVHQSASMSPPKVKSVKGNPNHAKAVSIKQNVPGFTEAQHAQASATQKEMNGAMHGKVDQTKVGELEIKSSGSGTNVTPSLDFEDVKAYYSLRNAGRSHEEALELVMQSRKQIEASGTSVVRVPTR